MKRTISILKPYLRWFIFGGTLFFLLKTLKDRFSEVAAIRVDQQGWGMLIAALLITLLAHIWSGWVWTWILDAFKQSLDKLWGIRVYLTTNVAKYLPGNVWHFYGRISAVSQAGGSLGEASLSVLLEPLLMAAAALIIGLTATVAGWLEPSFNGEIWSLQIVLLVVTLLGIHPRILNPIMHRLSQSKSKKIGTITNVNLHSYPLIPLLGEMIFILFRGMGFLLIFAALHSVNLQQIPALISAFSFAWLLGLIVPGAPGGIGIFEATAIALLDSSQFPQAIILATVACFRLISILAEAIAAGLAWLIPPCKINI